MIDEKLYNEAIATDLLADFDFYLQHRKFDDCEAIIDNLRDLKEYNMGIQLAKRLTARKMTVPADYGEEEYCASGCGCTKTERGHDGSCLWLKEGEENVLFREEDNPLSGVKVEGIDEETIY